MAKFEGTDLAELRSIFLQRQPDPLQVAELFQVFLARKGFGVSRARALDAACRVGRSGCSPDLLAKELEGMALAI